MATSAFEQAPTGGIAIPITNPAIAGIAIAALAVADKALAPEPASLSLLGALAGIGLVRWRRGRMGNQSPQRTMA
jgi:hypothetical protein